MKKIQGQAMILLFVNPLRKNAQRFFSVIFCCLIAFMLPFHSRAQQPVDKKEKALEHNKEAVLLLNTYHYDECRLRLKLAQEQMENNISYYLAARMNNMECKYDSAILNATKALELDPTFKPPYTELFKGHYGLGNWEKALEISENVPQSEPDGNISSQLGFISVALGMKGMSDILVPLFLLAFVGAFFIPLYFAGKQKKTNLTPAAPIRVTEVILVASAVCCLLWGVFFSLAHWIWSFNPHVDPYKFTLPLQIFIFERDGIESFCLYALMFGNLVLSVSIAPLLLKFRNKRTIYLALSAVLLGVAAYYYYNIRFIPPLAILAPENSVLLTALLSAIAIGFCFLYQKQRLITKLAIVFFIVCLNIVTAYPPSLFDLSYIIDPALRLMHGFKVSETYAQYDLFLTYLAMMCVKLNIPIEIFPYFGQLSYMALFVGIFLFSDDFFKNKWLSIPFIIVLVIARNYAIWDAGISIFQVSPLRIDLWLIVLYIAYKKGAQHWLLGLVLGLLVIFHRNLGLLYMGAYVQLLIALFIIELAPLIQEKRLTVRSIMAVAAQYIRRYTINLGILVAAVLVCFVMFGGLFSSTAIEYQKYGVGMLPISRVSFYWYMPVILSSVMLLVVYNRKKLDTAYVTGGMFVVLLAIANSMYFFGRSHENTILIISTLFVLALFIILDVMLFESPEEKAAPVPAPSKPATPVKNSKAAVAVPVQAPVSVPFITRRKLIILLPFLLVALSSYYYSDRIKGKATTQYANFQEHQFYFSIPSDIADTASIRMLTRHSDKLYFIDFKFDFPFYYFGHYVPVCHFNPSTAWIFNEDMIKYMQGLLDKNYYIVYQKSKEGGFEAVLPKLIYDHIAERENIVAISKENNPLTLPKSPGTVYHIAHKDTLPGNGLGHMLPTLENNFSIELLMRPSAVQGQDAAVFNNISQNYYLKGIGVQYNNKPGEYVVAVCNGSKEFPKVATFMLDDQWHYLCVSLQNDTIKVFDNGKRIVAESIGGPLMQNSDMPMYFGNVIGHNRHFAGHIREIKVSNGVLSDEDIARTAAQIGNLH